MSKYIDVNTGKEYNNIPKGKVQPLFINGIPVTESAYDTYRSKHPTQLEEVIIEPAPKINPEDTEQNLKYRQKVAKADALTAETSAFHKLLNFLSPSQYIGAAFDYFQGESPFWKGVYDGNSGWVPDIFARQYPRASVLINTGTDIALAHGIGKIYNWGTTPKLIGEGANKRAYSAPFSRKVYFEGADPEYIQTQNRVPGSLKYKLEKYDIDGKPVYSSPKVRIVSRPSKGFIKRAIKNQFFPTNVAGDTETVFINPSRQQVILDAEWGRNLFGRTYAVDPEVLSIPEYFSILKKGGKLNGTACKKSRF